MNRCMLIAHSVHSTVGPPNQTRDMGDPKPNARARATVIRVRVPYRAGAYRAEGTFTPVICPGK